MVKSTWFLIPILSLSLSGMTLAGESVDARIKQYTKVGGVAGNLNSIGSNPVNNLITY